MTFYMGVGGIILEKQGMIGREQESGFIMSQVSFSKTSVIFVKRLYFFLFLAEIKIHITVAAKIKRKIKPIIGQL